MCAAVRGDCGITIAISVKVFVPGQEVNGVKLTIGTVVVDSVANLCGACPSKWFLIVAVVYSIDLRSIELSLIWPSVVNKIAFLVNEVVVFIQRNAVIYTVVGTAALVLWYSIKLNITCSSK